MSRTVTQLPPGRHGLSRAAVRRSQRSRMLVAMAEATAERGYVGTSVAEVIRRAGVSRETFYEQFADKEACFLAAFDHAVAELTARVLAGISEDAEDGAPASDPFVPLDRALGVYLDVLAREKALARTFLIEVYGAGPAALRRRVAASTGFVDLIADQFAATGRERRFACEVFVGAVSSMVTMRIAADDDQGLLAMREPLMQIARRLLDDGQIRAGAGGSVRRRVR